MSILEADAGDSLDETSSSHLGPREFCDFVCVVRSTRFAHCNHVFEKIGCEVGEVCLCLLGRLG